MTVNACSLEALALWHARLIPLISAKIFRFLRAGDAERTGGYKEIAVNSEWRASAPPSKVVTELPCPDRMQPGAGSGRLARKPFHHLPRCVGNAPSTGIPYGRPGDNERQLRPLKRRAR